MRDNLHTSRRSALKKIGAAAAGVATIPGLASADKRQGGAEDEGIGNAVRRMLLENNIEQAHKLLDNHDVEYREVRSYEIEEENDGASTQHAYDDSNSWASNNLVHMSGDRYLATLNWEIGEHTYEFINGGAGNVDPISITWSDNYWEPVEVSRDNFWRSDSRVGYEDYQINGLLGYYDDPQPHNDGQYEEYSGSMQTEIYRLSYDRDYLVAGEYVHTYTGSGADSDWSFSIPIGGIVDINLSNYGKGEWRIDTSTRP